MYLSLSLSLSFCVCTSINVLKVSRLLHFNVTSLYRCTPPSHQQGTKKGQMPTQKGSKLR